ncbi:hypothetical protein ABTX81_30715 [Kitasatospora sp. NPDC097605]|uniref:hypothetical protein n=1 Tax=Kitasatospora sp. NPDC097605 TaxID=3157226 RepID=UPI00331E7884
MSRHLLFDRPCPQCGHGLFISSDPCRRCGRGFSMRLDDHDSLVLMAEGRSDREIGARFGKGASSGSRQVARVLSLTGATSRAQAVDLGCRTGLLDPPDLRDQADRVRARDLDAMQLVAGGATLGEAAQRLRSPLQPASLRQWLGTFYQAIGAGGAAPRARAVYLLHGMRLLRPWHPCRCWHSGSKAGW